MLRKKMGNKRGFTLVELMIAVVIMGILATLAVFGVMAYVRSVKTSEARHQLGFIQNGQIVQFAKTIGRAPLAMAGDSTADTVEHALCPETAQAEPATVPRGNAEQTSPANWTGPAWTCLGYSMDGTARYSYSMPDVVQPADGGVGTFTAQAQGDLDGDTSLSTFTLIGSADEATGRVNAGEISETNPNE